MKRKKMAPGKIIALSFAVVIMIGSIILMFPASHNEGTDVSFIDALFTSTSAVCVTGLIAVDTADTFSVFGRTIVALLIQIGGLGVTSIGVGLIAISKRKIKMRERSLAKEALNLDSFKGIISILKAVLFVTLSFEITGIILSFIVFSKDYPALDALGISAFHSIAAFNNSGFDILGGLQNLIPYQNNVLLNLTTCGLIIFGGIGFFVIRDMVLKRSFKKFSLHTKVVLLMTISLLAIGTILIKVTSSVTWLQAFFTSTSARTAGFSTFSLGTLPSVTLFIIIILMFIGASPGSTGGGIKTTTFFILIKSVVDASNNEYCTAFKRKIPKQIISKAFTITLLAISLVCISTLLLCVAEKQTDFLKLLFEVVSAFGTVGLSTGITPDLTAFSKFILVLTMYAGRVGPLTVAMLWVFKPNKGVMYVEETINIG